MENNNIEISDMVHLYQFKFEQIYEWIINLESKFGYISMGQFIRIIETIDLEREQKDSLLNIAYDKMDYGNYESYFQLSYDIQELYQKIFLLMMIEFVADYIKKKSYIVWEVIARYYMEEHVRFCPYDNRLDDLGSNQSSKGRIYNFFLKKNIDLQGKFNFLTQSPSMFEMVLQYFYNKPQPN